MRYRREIDGLRSVAVLPVILFHAGIEAFSGGYIGVDVFFVISGYLITTILLNDLEARRFSIIHFYERRARRILPALFVVVAACLPFAWAWMMPAQLENFATSVLAVSFFVSNVVFWQLAGYFAPAAEEMPLLHTWSLAVEEQYYIAVPIILAILWRFGWRAAFAMMLVMTIVSFALMEWANRDARISSAAVFYLIPFRAWELFVGSLCAFLAFGRDRWSSEVAAFAGLLMILVSIVAFDASTPFPSVYTLLPVLGTALIILFAHATYTARLLSLAPLVGIGLVSYSAYLWHQPLFAFARIRTAGEPPMALMLALAALALGLAYLSWRFVEQPARRSGAGLLPSRRSVFVASAAGIVAFAAVGLAGRVMDGMPGRMPPPVLAAYDFRIGDTSGCHNKFSAAEIRSGERCVIGANGAEPTLALLGDSHMGRLTDGFATLLAERGEAALTYNGSFCAPLINFTTGLTDRASCMARTNAAVDQIVSDPALQTVVLFAEWANYTTGGKIGGHVKAAYTAVSGDDDPLNRDVADNPQAVERALRATLSRLTEAGKSVVLVYPTPAWGFSVPDYIASTRLSDPEREDIRLPLEGYAARNREVLQIFSTVLSDFDAIRFDPLDILCGPDDCRALNEAGVSLYEDGNHMSYEGALLLASGILRAGSRSGSS